MRIGFVGLGNMGLPMARNLMRAGHEVVAYNRTRLVADMLAGEGAKAVATPAEAAHGREFVFTMLSDDAVVETVTLGASGLVEGLATGAVHVSMSTISAALSQKLTAAHAERGQQYVAAPVFGRPEAAAAAKLFIVAAGEASAIAKAKPAFEVLGQRTFEAGDRAESANIIKLLGNFLITCVLESLGEAFTVARKAEIDPKILFEVLTSTLFGAPVVNTYGPKILNEEFSPAGFKLPLGLKDNRLVLEAAEKLSAPMPFANTVRDRFLSAIASGYGDLDWSAMTLIIAESAGLKRS